MKTMNHRTFAAILLLTVSSFGVSHPGAHEQIEQLNLRIEHEQDNQSLYAQRGLVYSNDGQLDRALSDYKKAGAMGDPIRLAHEIGVVYYRQGNLEEALEHFDRFLRNFPKSAPTYEYRARVQRDIGNYSAALADLNRFLSLRSQPSPGHYVSAAELLLELDDNGYIAAIEILDQGIQRLGVVPHLQRRAIELELQQSRPDEALRRMKSLEVVLGGGPNWQVDMAELLMRIGDKPQAKVYVEQAATELPLLRLTPARHALEQRIAVLLQELDPLNTLGAHK
jgi:tetratricopeptide (TPR) repeat protein